MARLGLISQEAVDALPKGQVHEARAVASVTGPATNATSVETFLIDSSFTAKAGRRYRVTAYVPQVYGSVDGDRGLLKILSGASGSVIQAGFFRLEPNGGPQTIITTFTTTAAGTVPVRLSMTRDVGTGSWTMWCASNCPLLVLVDDVGPA